MSLRLGFHYHIPITAEDKYLRTPGYFGCFLDSIADQVDRLVLFLHSPRSDELSQMDYELEAKNIEWVNIGPHRSTPYRTLMAHQFTQHVRSRRDDLDALLIRGPSPLLPQMAKAAAPVPTVLLLVGDYLAGVDDLPQPWWRKELIRLWSRWNHQRQLGVARRSLTFVNSRQLYEDLQSQVSELHETRTTTLSASDFFYREDTCAEPPYHLLYTGRIDRAKGLFEMVEAVSWLIERDWDVVLDLVGWPAKNDTILDELFEYVEVQGLSDRVRYHGYKTVGPELFAYYKNADLYLIASRSSFEGFPRTIWEAMAHSLPVVATRVGSIPMYLEDGHSAVLVEPANSEALAAGVRRVLSDPRLRRRMINSGLDLARQNTLENRSTELIVAIENWLKKL